MALDLPNRRRPKRPGARSRNDQFRKAFPFLCVEHLRIMHTGNCALGRRHDDRTSDDGARQGAPSDFINSGDEPTRGAHVALEREEPPAPRHARYSVGALAALWPRILDAFAPTTARR
jgi:hypothetical protein